MKNEDKDGNAGEWKKLPIAWRVKGTSCDNGFLQNYIVNFLRRVEFQEAGVEAFGTTWIELFTLFKAMGYKDPIAQDGCGAKALPSLQKQIQAFKTRARKINREGIQGECKKYLGAGKKKGYALRRLGVVNHMPAILGKIRASERFRSMWTKKS